MISIYNTKSRQTEIFKPLSFPKVTLYHCGPTVYNYAHIGNMRAYVFADTLRRMLEWNNLETVQVINITDVGHLVSDEDEGEDVVEHKRDQQQRKTDEKHGRQFLALTRGPMCENPDQASAFFGFRIRRPL